MKDVKEIEALKSVKEKLIECKPEWLEKNVKGQDVLGVSTVRQILDYAVDGATTWDFILEKEWREEVMKLPKGATQWVFDGYVYHVRGALIIDGIGRRTQYGSKVAVGGKDNQNSSYKSAASDCLKKCASLFGVGSSIYSKIKIETEEQDNSYTNVQQFQPQVNTPQAQQQQQTNAQGLIQQGEWIWVNNQWVHQNEYYAQQQQQPNQGGQYPTVGLTNEQEKQQWYHDTMKQNDPAGYQEMRQVSGPSPLEKQQQTFQQVDQAVVTEKIDYPFENVPPKQETVYEAAPQGEVQQQNFQAVQYGVPIDPKTVTQPSQELKQEQDPLANVEAKNPWNSPDNVAQIEVFRLHKERIGIAKDNELLPHVREYFKDGTATIASITPETLIGFNSYLKNIQV
jgi:hypothetical protein